MTFFIFALSQNGARRNDVFNGLPFSFANPTFINDRLQTAYVFFIISCIYNTIIVIDSVKNTFKLNIIKILLNEQNIDEIMHNLTITGINGIRGAITSSFGFLN
jgi:hypothetical protein